ncbi:MAG: acyl-CoA dehydrogenase family protein [Actinobacteria bacterium]|nr:acyl-CoA dehydrogenase family protein [Actinomycetota bacterium]
MDFSLTDTELQFREDLRGWLRGNHPGELPRGDDAAFHFRWDWERRLSAGGWNCAHWPEEFGGRGVGLVESALFNEELALARAPMPANILGSSLAGPTIMAHGSAGQQARFLPGILAAEEIWCQGFSEPGAGSDLANISTAARPDQDGWRISGQKVWTSAAQYARWCMLLARTDPRSTRHHGLTYFLMDMSSAGVTVRPLRQMTGESEFNEVFIDEVWIPDDCVLGGVGNGWNVAMTTLLNERAGLAFGLQVQMTIRLGELTSIAAARGMLADRAIAQQLGDLHLRTEALRLTAYRGLSSTERYGRPGPEGSLTKWMWSDTNQRLTEFAVAVVGAEALRSESNWSYELLRARGNSIEGGTTEILKNIVAERVLGLPRRR